MSSEAARNVQVQQIADWRSNKGPVLIGATATLLTIGNFGVALRLLGQWRISRRFFVDDFLLIFAVLCADAYSGLFLVNLDCNWAYHPEELTVPLGDKLLQYTKMLLKVFYITTIFNGPVLLAIRLSLLHLYRRLLVLNEKWLRVFWWINYVYTVLWAIGTTIYYIFHCRPPSWFWNRINAKPDANGKFAGTCDPARAVSIPFIFSLVADIGILLIPIIVVARMFISKKRKFGLAILFSLGFLACACEVARIVSEFHPHDSSTAFNAFTNFAVFSMAEFHIAIFCACLPLCVTLYHGAIGFLRSKLGPLLGRKGHSPYPQGGYDQDSALGSLGEKRGNSEATARSNTGAALSRSTSEEDERTDVDCDESDRV